MGLQGFLLETALLPWLRLLGRENVSLVVILIRLKPGQLCSLYGCLQEPAVMFFELLSNAALSLTWRKLKH